VARGFARSLMGLVARIKKSRNDAGLLTLSLRALLYQKKRII